MIDSSQSANRSVKRRIPLSLISMIVICCFCITDFAQAQHRGGGHGGHGGGHGHGHGHHHPPPHHHGHHMHRGPTVFWHPIGFFLTAMAVTAIVVSVSNSNKEYYYDNGTYYEESDQDGQSGYVAVAAPIGATVPSLPDSSSQITVGDNTYYYYASTFYQADTDGEHYVVVQPPVGAVVPYLPDGYAKSTIDKTEYYIYASIYYLPTSEDGDIYYKVVEHPAGSP